MTARPPPPPPVPTKKAPPPPAPAAKSAPAPEGGHNALFAEILAKGDDIAKGLKHVSNDQKLYKQKREVQAVNFDDLERKKAVQTAKMRADACKEPVFKLAGKKWLVENQVGVGSLSIDDPEMMHAIQVTGCESFVLRVGKKVNSVTLVKCHRTEVYLCSVVSSVELISCTNCNVHVDKQLPAATVDNCKEIIITLKDPVLSRESEIVHSGTTCLNICVPEESDPSDFVEKPVPDQFVTTFLPDNKGGFTLVTKPADV